MIEGLPDSHAFFNICWGNTFSKLDNELGYLLDVDHIFALI